MPGFPVFHYLLEFAQTHVYWVGDAIQPSRPLSPPSTSALNLSQHQVLFQWVGTLHEVAKVLEFQLQHQSFWVSRADFLKIDCFDVLAVQETLKGLLQHHRLKASIPWHSTFFMVQLSHLYMTAGKTIALTRWTFVGKVMSLIFFREILIPYLFMGSPYSPTMRNKTVCHQGYFKHQLFSLNHRCLHLA